MKKQEKRTVYEEWQLIYRAVKIWNKLLPHYWTWEILGILTETFSHYFVLYMSSQMVNELAGECDIRQLLLLAAITVGGGFVLSIVYRSFRGRKSLLEQTNWQKHEALMLDAQNDFPYEHLENPDVVLLRSRIFATMNATGGGLGIVLWFVPKCIKYILDIIFSISLTIPMFRMVAPNQIDGFGGFINSEYAVLLIIGLIVINAVFSIKITTARTYKTGEVSGDLAKLNTYFDVMVNKLWGTDLAIFDLNRIVQDEFRKHMLRPTWVSESERITIQYRGLSLVLDAVLNICIYIFIAAKVYTGAFGIGNFILYQGTVKQLIEALSGLASEVSALKFNNQYLIQLYDYLDLPNNMYQGTLAVEKRDDIDYEIEFRDVSFKYPRTDTWALRHVNMKFKIGDKLAIVGENGSGKSTFIKLLCRLYDPTEGKILLNGIDITRYRYEEYMGLFSVVFQDYTLFGFPLGENVAADYVYDAKKVRDCLIRAGMGEKLASLDQDAKEKGEDALQYCIGREYDSEGIDFSGGEKQKIALARALYKDAPFVILDEPTAALDPIAEAEVYENFNRVVLNKTAVFISHRLSSCRFCDRIAVFDRGQLVQEGAHDALLAEESGKYRQLWYAQAKYYVK